MQQTAPLDFDIAHFKSTIEQAPTKENGWNLEYEGKVDKDFKDSIIKVYQKKDKSSSGYTIRMEGVLKGVKAENLVKMQREISYRAKDERPPKQVKIVEETSKNTDIMYIEIDLPFPMTNRDFVQKRLFVRNKEDPELVKQLGLWNWDHAYNVVMIQSVERPEYPVKSKPIRAETSINFILFEEDPTDKTSLKVTWVLSQDLKGDIPKMVINSMGEKVPKKIFTEMLKNHEKNFGKA